MFNKQVLGIFVQLYMLYIFIDMLEFIKFIKSNYLESPLFSWTSVLHISLNKNSLII